MLVAAAIVQCCLNIIWYGAGIWALIDIFGQLEAQTRKSIGRVNFTANNKRLSNGMICRKYPIAKLIKR
jgi:hypothetical protein